VGQSGQWGFLDSMARLGTPALSLVYQGGSARVDTGFQTRVNDVRVQQSLCYFGKVKYFDYI